MLLDYDEILTLQCLVENELFQLSTLTFKTDLQVGKLKILTSLKDKLQDYAINSISMNDLRNVENAY